MKRKIFFILLVVSMIPFTMQAHKLLLNVYSNEDDTITIEGLFNTGESATGALVKLKSKLTNEIMHKERLPLEGELTLEIPNVPYQILLEGGKGHNIIKDGIAPSGGYSEELIKKAKEAMSKVVVKQTKRETPWHMIISALITFTLFSLTIFVSIRNTRKLVNHLENSKKS